MICVILCLYIFFYSILFVLLFFTFFLLACFLWEHPFPWQMGGREKLKRRLFVETYIMCACVTCTCLCVCTHVRRLKGACVFLFSPDQGELKGCSSLVRAHSLCVQCVCVCVCAHMFVIMRICLTALTTRHTLLQHPGHHSISLPAPQQSVRVQMCVSVCICICVCVSGFEWAGCS